MLQNNPNTAHIFTASLQKFPLPVGLLTPSVNKSLTHLPCPELPVCCQAVRRIHEDFGDAQSFLDGLELETQQVAVNAVSLKCLSRGGKIKVE